MMRCKGGLPPLMIYTALRAAMICQACGLDKQKQNICFGRQMFCFCWPARQDLNLRPSESESDALSSCATGRYLIKTCTGKSYCEFYQEAKMLACKGIFATPSITQACESTGKAKPETCESKSYCVIITHFSPDCKHFLAKSFVFFVYFRLQD